MFDFGITGHRPSWLTGVRAVAGTHGPRLAALVGRTLGHVWLVWDLDADEWFADCPVLFDFDGEQMEVDHQKFDEVSITWNSIDPHRPVVWSGFRLAWRPEPSPALQRLSGRRVEQVELLEWAGDDLADGSVAVSLAVGGDRVSVHNALDENGLEFGPPRPEYRRHPVT